LQLKIKTMETLLESDIDRRMASREKELPGWGIDADGDNNPTYPMKKYTGADHERSNYEKSAQQTQSIEVLRSTERPTISRVFGTSTPPKGLSGVLRRYAFKFSEASSAHWLTLLLADRVNVVEGLVDDLAKGYVPNVLKERGWTAEWKYNRQGAIKSIAVGAVVTTAVVALLIYRSRSKRLVKS
jgi:hypothetical protein